MYVCVWGGGLANLPECLSGIKCGDRVNASAALEYVVLSMLKRGFIKRHVLFCNTYIYTCNTYMSLESKAAGGSQRSP